MSIDHFFQKVYNPKTYNCAHFVSDVWLELCGHTIADKLEGFLRPPKERKVSMELRHQFEKLGKPESPCIALMQRRKSVPHVGIFLRGRILHIQELGVQFQPVDVVSRTFDSVGFYK